MTYHFFLSLALLFLRDEVGFSHNDVKGDNVMLRMCDGVGFGLPQPVFVDFGLSCPLRGNSRVNYDAKRLCRVLAEVARVSVVGEVTSGRGEREWVEWEAFKGVLEGEGLQEKPGDVVDAGFKGVWEWWRGVAEGRRERRTEGEVGFVGEVWGDAVQRARVLRDEDFVEAVGRVNWEEVEGV